MHAEYSEATDSCSETIRHIKRKLKKITRICIKENAAKAKSIFGKNIIEVNTFKDKSKYIVLQNREILERFSKETFLKLT